MVDVHGTVAESFHPVRDTFAANCAKGGEVGASVCVTVAGETVVDLWFGHQDKARTRPWERDTRCVIFSSTKGVAATALLMLIDRGKLDPDQTVAHYWPDFAQAGKEQVTVADLLNHRSGLSAMQEKTGVDLFADPEAADTYLARQQPLWPSNSRQGYCATSLGAYAGALFRRVQGESIGTFVKREITDPLGAEFSMPTPPELDDLVADIIPVPTAARIFKALPGILTGGTVEGRIARGVLNRKSTTHRALLNPDMGSDPVLRFNDHDIRRLELPWGNGIGNARGLATLYAPLANGGAIGDVRLVQPETIARVTPRLSWEQDQVLHKQLGFSLGYLKENPEIFSPNSEAFGHAGIGGSLGMADPVTRMSFGYVMNRMDHRLRSPRAIRLCAAVYHCL